MQYAANNGCRFLYVIVYKDLSMLIPTTLQQRFRIYSTIFVLAAHKRETA